MHAPHPSSAHLNGFENHSYLGEGDGFYVANFLAPEEANLVFHQLSSEVTWHSVRARIMVRQKSAFVIPLDNGAYDLSLPIYRYSRSTRRSYGCQRMYSVVSERKVTKSVLLLQTLIRIWRERN